MRMDKLSNFSRFGGPFFMAAFKKETDVLELKFLQSLHNVFIPIEIFKKRGIPKGVRAITKRFENLEEGVKKDGYLLLGINRDIYDTSKTGPLPGFSFETRMTFRVYFLATSLFYDYLPFDQLNYILFSYDNQHRPFGPPEHISIVLDRVTEIIRTLDPVYVAGDGAKLFDKATGKDPRKYCWAYNYFSSEMLEGLNRIKIEELTRVNQNWLIEPTPTGGIIFRLREPFDQKRKKEYTSYKRHVEKALELKKRYPKKLAPPQKVTRESYGHGSKTRLDYDKAFTMFFAIEKGQSGQRDYLGWLKTLDREFKGNYHDSLLEEWAGMLASGTMGEGLELGDICYDINMEQRVSATKKFGDMVFIFVNVGVSFFEDRSCHCENLIIHDVDCEQWTHINDTIKFFKLTVESLAPRTAVLGEKNELRNIAEIDLNIDEYLFSLTFVSSKRLQALGLKVSQLKLPIINVKNGLIIDFFSYIFSFNKENNEERELRKKSIKMLGLK